MQWARMKGAQKNLAGGGGRSLWLAARALRSGVAASDSQGGCFFRSRPLASQPGGHVRGGGGESCNFQVLTGAADPSGGNVPHLLRRSPMIGRRCPPIAPDWPPWPDERQVKEKTALYRSLSRALVGAALPATPGLKIKWLVLRRVRFIVRWEMAWGGRRNVTGGGLGTVACVGLARWWVAPGGAVWARWAGCVCGWRWRPASIDVVWRGAEDGSNTAPPRRSAGYWKSPDSLSHSWHKDDFDEKGSRSIGAVREPISRSIRSLAFLSHPSQHSCRNALH